MKPVALSVIKIDRRVRWGPRLTGWFGIAVTLSAQSPPVVTLAQAVNEALVKNERIINQHDTTEQASLGVRLARNAFQPKVIPNILGSFGQTDVNSQNYRVDVAQKFVTGTELRTSIGTSTSQIPTVPGDPSGDLHFYNADTTLTVSQPLLRGFGRGIARRSLTSAELRRADADRQQTLTEQQVAVDVASAYYRVVAQQAFVDVAKKTVDRAVKLRDASDAKLTAGLVSQLDVLRAQQLVSQAEIQLFDAESAAEDARDRLAFLMGRDAGERFEVESEIPKADTNVDADNAVAVALANRLDLKSALAGGTDADRQVSFARNQLLPQVDVNFALTRRETADSFARSFGLDRFQFATFFTIAMPVDRTPQLIEYQNALIDRDRRKRDVATLQRRVSDDVRRATRDRDRLLRALKASEASVDIGRKEVEVAQLRYERGLSNNLDVVTAEGNLLSAESRRISVLADLAVSRLSLRALLGILDARKDIAAGSSSLPGDLNVVR
jgi:outer membrane protein TolC